MFGVALEITVRLEPIPATIRTLLTAFDSVRHASEAVSGIIASGVTVSGLSYFGAGCTGALPAQTTGGIERLITLSVNGQARRVDVLPAETLAMTLRYKLGLTGTKLGCDRAECGACTVLIDGVTHYSCSTLTHRVRAREITTVEGLGTPEHLHPIQEAFWEAHGAQCGFCTPAILMTLCHSWREIPIPMRLEFAMPFPGIYAGAPVTNIS